jgi:hypothetical protein
MLMSAPRGRAYIDVLTNLPDDDNDDDDDDDDDEFTSHNCILYCKLLNKVIFKFLYYNFVLK